MIRLTIVALLSLSACSATPPPVDTDPPTISTGSTTSTTVVPPKYSDEGSVVLSVQHPDAVNDTSSVTLSAMFAEERRGYVNLAQCVSTPISWCAPELPTVEDDYVVVEAYQETLTDNLRTVSVGNSIDFAGYTVASQNMDGHTIYFASNLLSQGLPSGALDLSFSGGDWGDFSGTAVDGTPDTLVVTSPDPLRETGHVAGRDIEVRWNSGGNGEIYLAVLTPSERRLYLLADDGEFDLDTSSLSLTNGDDLDLVLGRWTTNTLDQEGNDIRIEVHDEQWIHGVYRDLGGRTEIIPEDSCFTAQSMPPLTAGTYFGDITSYADNTNPGASGCTGARANGQDGILRVVLPDQTWFEAELGFINDDGSMYLLGQCGSTQTCLTGSDSTFGAGSIESLQYFNNSGVEEELFLV
ncbi:MAG: hypothetical protein GWP91_07895, partial [Rhodobacterales bacterium]|nr:hypothetical protein [Rhodobacterales bacterium]